MKLKLFIVFVFIIAIGVAGFLMYTRPNTQQVPTPQPPAPEQETPINSVSFSCNQNKVIQATFFKRRVALVLSDGRKLDVPQAISASGARYANTDESFVFWNKGDTAFVDEGGKRMYDGCVIKDNALPTIPTSWQTYRNLNPAWSISYPEGYTISTKYVYDQLGPGKEIKGVSLTIPVARAKGTNLSTDTRISIETLPGGSGCSATAFLDRADHATTLSEGGVTYSVADANGAGAGNFYEEKVYAFSQSSPCIAVRYFIHSSNIGNYDPGAVQEFDRSALLAEFDRIRASLVLKK